MRLRDKVILVTGAGSGMGRVATRMFAEQGAKVVATDVDEAGLAESVREAGDAVRDAIVALPGDVTSDADVRRMVETAVSRFGRLNVLYNNAGIMPNEDTSVVATDEAVLDKVLDVNVKGVFLCCKHGVPALQAAGGGSIVNLASFVALMGCVVPQDAYTASKGAVLALTRSL